MAARKRSENGPSVVSEVRADRERAMREADNYYSNDKLIGSLWMAFADGYYEGYRAAKNIRAVRKPARRGKR